MSQFRRVKRFMWRHGQCSSPSRLDTKPPHVPSDEVVRLRCRMLLEETLEFIDACICDPADKLDLKHHRERLEQMLSSAEIKVDLVAYAHESADVRFVAYGNDVAAGIDGDATDLAVAESNDTKQGVDANGKITKGPNYVPPAIEATLRADGWKP